MSDQPEIDPKRVQNQHPDYVEDVSGSDHVESQPDIGTDPESTIQEGKHKTIIAPDPEKVRDAERKGRGF